MNERRRKIVPISHRLLIDLFTVGNKAVTICCTEGLPPDARMVGHGYDFQADTHYLVFESAEWEPVEDFAPLPRLLPQFTRYAIAPLLDQAAELLVNARAEQMGDRDYSEALRPWLADYDALRKVLE